VNKLEKINIAEAMKKGDIKTLREYHKEANNAFKNVRKKVEKTHFAYPYDEGTAASCNRNMKKNLVYDIEKVTCKKCLPAWKRVK